VCVCVVPVSKARKNEEIKIVIPAGLMAITRDKWPSSSFVRSFHSRVCG
jgi:hypothetical protein